MKKGFIFDLDGTVYLENKLIDGAVEVITHLRDRGDKVVFLTNKSIESIGNYVDKLNRLGIQVNTKEVINSNYLTALYLKTKLKNHEKVLVIGERPLIEELLEESIPITEKYKEASYVVLGWDRNFTYEKLNNVFQAWQRGASIVATNPDRTCPQDGGQVPDTGAIIGAIEGATGEKVEAILGKPSQLATEYIVKNVLQLPPEQCFIVGDRLETDIRMANNYGLQSVLVLTGITNEAMLEDAIDKPTVVFDSIKEVVNL